MFALEDTLTPHRLWTGYSYDALRRLRNRLNGGPGAGRYAIRRLGYWNP